MNKLIQLGLLAALAGGSAHGVTVSFSDPTPSSAVSFNSTGDNSLIVARSYTYNPNAIVNLVVTPTWSQVLTGRDSGGVGVDSGNQGGSAYEVEGTWKEYVVLDFTATSTGTVRVDSISMNFPNVPQSPTYFTYQWISALPSGGTPSVPGTFVNYTTLVNQGPNTITTLTGTGSYLILGAVNGTFSTTNMFSVTGLTYTSVPDGASTLALMGAAVATLGLAARRRKQ